MLRAIIVNVGTVAGVSAALLYQPQADLLEFAGGALSSGTDTSIDQNQSADGDQSNSPVTNGSNDSGNDSGASSSNGGKNKGKKNKNDGNSPSPGSSSSSPNPSQSSATPEPSKSDSPSPKPSNSPTPTPSPTPTKTKTPSPTPTPTPSPTAADGTYVGSRVDVIYVDGGTKRKSGTLKTNVVIKNGKVVDIVWTEYPTGEHLKYTNHAYTQSAKPLIGLTIAELKAKKIATKTGATGTSTAFATSLQAVLQQL
jgi:outer membrane biosynthesis protein TonB